MDQRTIASLLARVEPFGELDEGTRLDVAGRAGRRVVGRGQIVCWQGEPGDSMFVLLDGAVKLVVHSKDGELVELGRPDHVAEERRDDLELLRGSGRAKVRAEVYG